MSWMGFIDSLTRTDPDGKVLVCDAAIWGRTPHEESVWATSPGLANMTAEEVRRLAGDSAALRAEGPTVGGLKYLLLNDNRDDPKVLSMNLKKKDHGALAVGNSTTALVIAMVPEGGQPSEATKRVHNIVEYLKNQNM